MTPRNLKLLFVTFSYGGNGGLKSEVPEVGRWLGRTLAKAAADERVAEGVLEFDLCKSPIAHARNVAVVEGRKLGVDVLVMIDSDQVPDMYLGYDKFAKPFWDSSFDFLYENYDKFPTVIAAPYCSSPPHPIDGGEEQPYIFQWVPVESDCDESRFHLEKFSRAQCVDRTGIEEVAALPTGLSMWDMRAFKLIEPPPGASPPGWFYEDYADDYGAEKVTTSDVAATRNISFAGSRQLGHNPVHINWDAWAGHAKLKVVGKPEVLSVAVVGEKMARALQVPDYTKARLTTVDFTSPPAPPAASYETLAEQKQREKSAFADEAIVEVERRYNEKMTLSDLARQAIRDILPEGKTILELGSGEGTNWLSEFYEMISIEDNLDFMHKYGNVVYITSEISADGWYTARHIESQLRQCPEYDFLLIDGPRVDSAGTIKRSGMIPHLDMFNLDVPILIDDVDRDDEKLLLEAIVQRTGREAAFHRDGDRMFAVIPGVATERSEADAAGNGQAGTTAAVAV